MKPDPIHDDHTQLISHAAWEELAQRLCESSPEVASHVDGQHRVITWGGLKLVASRSMQNPTLRRVIDEVRRHQLYHPDLPLARVLTAACAKYGL